MAASVIERQRSEGLDFRGSEQGVALLLLRPFSLAVDTHNLELITFTSNAECYSRL